MAQWVEACKIEGIAEEDVIRFDHCGRSYAVYRSPDDAF